MEMPHRTRAMMLPEGRTSSAEFALKNPFASLRPRPGCAMLPSDILGPYPATSVGALADLGLTDQEIADYFHVAPQRIRRLRLTGQPELRQVCADATAAGTAG